MEENKSTQRFSHAKAFPSKFFREADLMGREASLTIKGWRYPNSKDVGLDGKTIDRGLVLSFAEREKEFVCNSINYKAITRMHGPDPDQWAGKKVTFKPSTCRVGSDPKTPCIRVKFERVEAYQKKGGAS